MPTLIQRNDWCDVSCHLLWAVHIQTSRLFIWAFQHSCEFACWMFRMGVSVLVNRHESQLFLGRWDRGLCGLACGHYPSLGHWVNTVLVERTTQTKYLRFELLRVCIVFICISLKLILMWTNSLYMYIYIYNVYVLDGWLVSHNTVHV